MAPVSWVDLEGTFRTRQRTTAHRRPAPLTAPALRLVRSRERVTIRRIPDFMARMAYDDLHFNLLHLQHEAQTGLAPVAEAQCPESSVPVGSAGPSTGPPTWHPHVEDLTHHVALDEGHALDALVSTEPFRRLNDARVQAGLRHYRNPTRQSHLVNTLTVGAPPTADRAEWDLLTVNVISANSALDDAHLEHFDAFLEDNEAPLPDVDDLAGWDDGAGDPHSPPAEAQDTPNEPSDVTHIRVKVEGHRVSFLRPDDVPVPRHITPTLRQILNAAGTANTIGHSRTILFTGNSHIFIEVSTLTDVEVRVSRAFGSKADGAVWPLQRGSASFLFSSAAAAFDRIRYP